MTALKFIRHKESGEITRSIEQPLIGRKKHIHLDSEGNILPEYEYLSQDEINVIILPELKEHKKKLAKIFRDEELLKSHPQTVSAFIGTELENVNFKIKKEDKAEFVSNTLTMTDEQTRGWNDADGIRRNLTKSNFNSLLSHLNNRDNNCYNQEALKAMAIEEINPSETKTLQEAVDEVMAFNVENDI